MATIIGNRVRSLREHTGWSQEDLARESGLKRPHISLIETGERTPAAETLVKLADTFKVSIDYLLGRSDVPSLAPGPNHPALKDPSFVEFANLWPQLDPEDRKALLHFARKTAAKEGRKSDE